MNEITQQWATNYYEKLIKTHGTFSLGRKKTWGGIDSVAYVKNADEFFIAYKEFNDHPRCVAIILIDKNDKLTSI